MSKIIASKKNASQWLFTIAFVMLSLISVTKKVNSQPVRVLFLGNSYTAANNLPELVANLASSGGYSIFVNKNTPGGYTLAHPDNGHLYNATSLTLIEQGNWDYVVLQEQSQFPVIDYYRNNFTYPGAYQLDSIIREKNECGKTLFYMTWGRKYGGEQCIDTSCSIPFTDYAHMQDSLASAYMNMSNGLETPVSPVGLAWKKSIVEYGDPIELFSSDGSHPSMAGSYLAACTFYCAIFNSSPEGLEFDAGLNPEFALYLQTVAAEIVLANTELWNIDTTTVRSDFTFEISGMEVEFQNLSVNADNYLWDFGTGDTDTTANPTYVYSESGEYEVVLVSTSGCKVDSSVHVVEIVVSDIRDIPEGKCIYPNPGNGSINIPLTGGSENFRIEVYDTEQNLLQKIFESSFSDYVVWDCDAMKPGMYFIKVYASDSQTITYKFVKK